MIQFNGQTLAYIGDAVYELLVREHLLTLNLTKVGKLHNYAVKYTSAEGQFKALELIKTDLSEEELSLVKRGRNAQLTRKSRSTDLTTYQHATGLESLFGALRLQNKNDRIEALFKIITIGMDQG